MTKSLLKFINNNLHSFVISCYICWFVSIVFTSYFNWVIITFYVIPKIAIVLCMLSIITKKLKLIVACIPLIFSFFITMISLYLLLGP